MARKGGGKHRPPDPSSALTASVEQDLAAALAATGHGEPRWTPRRPSLRHVVVVPGFAARRITPAPFCVPDGLDTPRAAAEHTSAVAPTFWTGGAEPVVFDPDPDWHGRRVAELTGRPTRWSPEDLPRGPGLVLIRRQAR